MRVFTGSSSAFRPPIQSRQDRSLILPAQSVKEPLFSLNEDGGFGTLSKKYKQHSREKGVIPTPICQFFQIHGMLLFRIRKDPLNGFFALCINLLRTLRLSDLLHQIQILLPNMGCENFLPLFVRSAQCPAGTVSAFLRSASVYAFAIPVGSGVPCV